MSLLLRILSIWGGAAPVSVVRGDVVLSPEQIAVKTMKDLISSRKLQSYYDAAIGKVDNPELKKTALELFAALPKINGRTTADDFVKLGLWTRAPLGIEDMQKTARYLPGRPLMVETTVDADRSNSHNFLQYKEGGIRAVTYRATLVGEADEDNFLVKVDGHEEPLKVLKTDIYKLNQPNDFEEPSNPDALLYDIHRSGLGKKVDYNEAFLKAKIAEAAIKMDEYVSKIDFSKLKVQDTTSGASHRVTMGRTRDVVELQRQCVKVIHDVIDMKYPNHDDASKNEPIRTAAGRDAGRQAISGLGVCHDQAAVMAGVLWPFHDKIGVDLKMYYGHCYRNLHTADDPFNSNDSPHSWLQLDYRPTMERRICDRTWGQADTTADVAYSLYGDRYPHRTWYKPKMVPVSAADVNCSGDITIASVDRQFGVKGRDGRENHMTRTQG